MLSETFSPPCSSQTCYFSIVPSDDLVSTETPCYSPTYNLARSPVDPSSPVLAHSNPENARYQTSSIASAVFSLLQMQTAAAYGNQPTRPRPYPIQNVLHVTSDDSVSSDDSSSSLDSTKSSLDLARCSRCQRTPSVDAKTGKSNMVQYGLNLWYCTRCANLVGLNNR